MGLRILSENVISLLANENGLGNIMQDVLVCDKAPFCYGKDIVVLLTRIK